MRRRRITTKFKALWPGVVFFTALCVLTFPASGFYAGQDSQSQPKKPTDKMPTQSFCEYTMECEYPFRWNMQECACTCPTSSPILIDTSGDGIDLTGPADGVFFDIKAAGASVLVAWTEVGSDDVFLCYDRNGNGRVDDGTELFGDRTPQPESSEPNGFAALAMFDITALGGNGDGLIDKQDAIYSSLRLWKDKIRNGVSDPGELSTLASFGVDAISLDYKSSRRHDRYGNEFRYRAKVYGSQGKNLGRWAWDVFLLL